MRCFRQTVHAVGKTLLVAALAVSCLVPTPAFAAASPDKTETVHVQTDALGTVSEVTVEVLLANNAKEQKLTDHTKLSEIKPSDAAQTYTTTSDGSLVWVANGKQVNYRGKSSDKPPVDVRFSYQLDGVAVQPIDLAGATGHLKLRVDYRNASSSQREVSGEKRVVYTPFVCVTIVTLDGEAARNVTVTNGSIMEDKGGCAVVGYAVPGLEESLSLDIDGLDLDLPTYVEIEADVTDFELDPIYTMVTAEPFEDLDTSDLDDRDSEEGADGLRDAMSQLIDGSGALTDALDQLAQGGAALGGGADALREALGALPSGLSELKAGAQTLADRLGEASGVVEGLAQASAGISGAAAQAAQGLGEASERVSQAQSSVSDLRDALAALGLGDVRETIAAAKQATLDAQAAVESANALIGQAAGDAEAQKVVVAQGLQDARDALDGLLADESLNLTEEQQTALSERVASVQAQIDAAMTDLDAVDVSAPEGLADAVSQLSSDAEALAGHAATLESTTLDVDSIDAAAQDALSELDEASGALGESQESLAPVSSGAQSVSEGLTGVAAGLSAAQDAAGALSGALGTMANQTPQVLSGIDALSSGLDQLTAGTSAAAEGSGALTDALATLDAEGIAKVVDVLSELNDSVDDISGSLDALRAAARDYDSFSGKLDGQSGSVRFIYQTERIGL